MERQKQKNPFGVRDFYMVGRPPANAMSIPLSPLRPVTVSSAGCWDAGGSAMIGVGSAGGDGGGMNYIQHAITRFDTLAGVAIKYGVDVADIKKLNGFTTDQQMFALRTLQIPLPGRHPPSPILSEEAGIQNSDQSSASSQGRSDLFDSFPSLKIKSSNLRKASPAGSLGMGRHRKSKSMGNVLLCGISADFDEYDFSLEAGEGDCDKWAETLIRMRQRPEPESNSRPPEKLLKDENSGGSGFSIAPGKSGLALRSKSGTKASCGGEGEAKLMNNHGLNRMRRTYSTPSLQEAEDGRFPIVWQTSKGRSDLQGNLGSGNSKAIFDGLPKPICGRKNKTALD